MSSSGFEKFFVESPGTSKSIFDICSTLSSSGDWRETEGTETIIRRIITNLYIVKGTYIFDPEFGSSIYKYIYEPADSVTLQKITTEVSKIVNDNKSGANVTFDILFFKNQKGFRINIIIDTENGTIKKIPVDINDTLLKEY